MDNNIEKIMERVINENYEAQEAIRMQAIPDSISIITDVEIDRTKFTVEKLRSQGWDVFLAIKPTGMEMEYNFQGVMKTKEEYHTAFAEILSDNKLFN